MKIEEIDVRGFGRLREVSIALNPRVTIILGENEAGKSTLHRVVRAALYGVDAGGQGRAVERSEWARWAPWTAGSYGFAVTLALDAGRRVRIAARLDNREQRIQVFEIGGGDITTEMRNGRAVAPGLHLLGIDENVFCATSWLGEDGLRLGAPETAPHRARSLQEAVERLADSGRGTTTAEAIGRLREAIDRVGSERRSQSPLAVAVTRHRQLELEVETARRRAAGYAADEASLRSLERAVDDARRRQIEAELAWLVGRLAAIGTERLEVQRAAAQAAELTDIMAATADAADFPVEDEPTVLALAGEWRQANASAIEVEARFEAALPTLERTRRRRASIATGLDALGDVPEIPADVLADRAGLGAELESAEAELQRLASSNEASARATALRREIAGTGLASVKLGSIDAIGPLIDVARNGQRPRWPGIAAAAVALVAVIGALVLGAIHRSSLGGGVAGVGVVLALACLALGRLRGDGSGQARRQLGRLCPELDLSDLGLQRAADRLPTLAALHNDLLRQEVRAAAQRDEIERAGARRTAVVDRILSAAAHIGVVEQLQGGNDSPASVARAVLGRIDELAESAARKAELTVEDTALAQTESLLALLGHEATRARASVDELEARLRGRLGSRSLDVPLAIGVTDFSARCALRRRHDMAAAQLAALQPRLTGGDDADRHLAEVAGLLSRELVDRGGDPSLLATAPPLDPAELATLEREATTARQRAEVASLQAAQLSSRMNAALEGLPDLADLEDELRICSAARDRALQQRAALAKAIDILEASTRGVHRELAPRLAESISDRLGLLTDGRYTGVNVDTDHFAITLQGRERPDLVPLDQVSHGTRDQVSLLLRLALAEVLSDGGESVPLFLDEPLLSADPQRRGMTLDFLCALSARHQVLITTSDPALAEAVLDRLHGDATLAVLESPAPALRVDGVSVGIELSSRLSRH